jgi:exodeoxyribonuclease (lambda-induced)
LGRIGGSESNVLTVKGKSDHGLGAGAITLMYEKLFEIKTGQPAKDVFVTDAMQRGIDLEMDAIYEYSQMEFKDVEECGYITNSDLIYAGYSPDGLVGEDGLIEVKCPGSIEYMRIVLGGEIPGKYYCQMQWGMFISERKWCDYVVYNPDYEPKPLVVQRVDRDENFISNLLKYYLVFQAKMGLSLLKLK